MSDAPERIRTGANGKLIVNDLSGRWPADVEWVRADLYDAALKLAAESDDESDDARELLKTSENMRDRIQDERDAALDSLAEMTRRRDEWKAKAEGYDAVRLALREKVGSVWRPNMSRAIWAGIAADEKKRADDALARVAELENALLSEIVCGEGCVSLCFVMPGESCYCRNRHSAALAKKDTKP